MVLPWYSVWYSIFGRPRKNINIISFVTSYIETQVSEINHNNNNYYYCLCIPALSR